MSEQISELLEAALASIERGESTAAEWLARYPEQSSELSALLGAAETARAASLPAPDPHFRSAARARLLTGIASHRPLTVTERFGGFIQALVASLRNPTAGAQVYPRRNVRLSFVVVLAVMVSLLLGGTAYASGGALPGDPLYPVKTGIEDLRLSLGGESNSDLYLKFSDSRVKEIEALMERGRYEDLPAAAQRFAEQVEAGVEAYESEAQTGTEAPQHTPPQDMLAVHTGVLNELLSHAPAQAQPALELAVEASNKAKDQAEKHPPRQKPVREPKDKKNP